MYNTEESWGNQIMEFEDLTCPLSLRLFADPVTAMDGHVYERELITNWLDRKDISPVTFQKIGTSLVAADNIKEKVAELLAKNPQYKEMQFSLSYVPTPEELAGEKEITDHIEWFRLSENHKNMLLKLTPEKWIHHVSKDILSDEKVYFVSNLAAKLVNVDADLNGTDNSGLPFEYACKTHKDLGLLFLEKGMSLVSNKYFPLFSACKYGRVRVVKKLLDLGVNPNLRNERGETALHYCVTHEMDDNYDDWKSIAMIMVLLFNYGAVIVPDYEGTTPVHRLCQEEFNHIDMVLPIMFSHAGINDLDDNGYSPLALACLEDNDEMVNFLLNIGADTNWKGDDGRTLLHITTDIEILKSLNHHMILTKEYLDSVDNYGWTALHHHTLGNYTRICRWLIFKGASKNIKTTHDQITEYSDYKHEKVIPRDSTPYDIAKSYGLNVLFNLLDPDDQKDSVCPEILDISSEEKSSSEETSEEEYSEEDTIKSRKIKI